MQRRDVGVADRRRPPRDHPRQARPDESAPIRLGESGGTTTETVDLDIKVGIPLVGGKIEGLIADMLLKALRAEKKVGRDYLSR